MLTDEKYTRPPEIEAQLVALPAPTASDYLDRLQRVPIEVVVIARRQTTGRKIRNQIDSILVERSVPRIRSAVSRHSGVPFEELDEETHRGTLNEAESEAMFLFWREIQCESFFEVRFNLATVFLAKRAGRNLRGGKQRARERSALRIGSNDSEESNGRTFITDVPDDSDDYTQFENRYLIEAGLASLTDEQARAISLHYLLGLQIYSNDSAVPTVASKLGCGERKARKLIADGKAALRCSIGQEDGDEQY